jgi:hypothetical protein
MGTMHSHGANRDALSTFLSIRLGSGQIPVKKRADLRENITRKKAKKLLEALGLLVRVNQLCRKKYDPDQILFYRYGLRVRREPG